MVESVVCLNVSGAVIFEGGKDLRGSNDSRRM